MKKILNNISEGIIICKRSGKIIFCNDNALKYLKFTSKELLGENIFIKVMTLKGDLNENLNSIYELKNRLGEKLKVGGRFIFSEWENQEAIYFIFNVEEINMKKVSEKLYHELKKRKEAEVELEGFLSTATDFMCIIDDEGNFLKTSLGWKMPQEWKDVDFEKINWHSIAYPEDIDSISKKVKESKYTGKLVETEGRFRNKKGEWRWISSRSVYDNNRNVFINTSKDVTEDKKMKKERLKYEKMLELDNIRKDFFANISHEFKTPLNIILSLIQLMDVNIRDNKVIIKPLCKFRRYMELIRQNSFRLLRLSNNIIDMTKIDSGFYKIYKINYDIVYLMDNIVESISEYVESKGIEFVFDPEVEELITACDPEKIERIVLNLISNAIKYIEEDGKILIKLKEENNNVVISIQDNGIGITEENIDIIFERFKQVDRTLTRKVEGSGIGLSLVKSLVKLHDGDIWIESNKSKGTCVTFTIPITYVDESSNNNMPDYKVFNKNEVWEIEFADIYD